jgi:hypothetical protein
MIHVADVVNVLRVAVVAPVVVVECPQVNVNAPIVVKEVEVEADAPSVNERISDT